VDRPYCPYVALTVYLSLTLHWR